MRIGRAVTTALCAAVLCAPAAVAQRAPVGGAVRIERVTPAALETSKEPAEVTLTGAGFAPKAVVRIRKSGDRGGGLDYQATVDSPTQMRVRIPVEFLDSAGKIEVRVKNPDGVTSEWAPIDVKARAVPGGDVGSRKPVVERVSPSSIPAESRNVHVTLYGRDLADGATVTARSGNVNAEVRGNLVNGALVILFPDELLAKPQAVLLQVRNPGGGVSDNVRVDVVAPSGGPAPGDLNDPFIVQVDPQRVDLRNASNARLEVLGRGVDPKGAKVLLRPEGSNEAGKILPTVERTPATNGTVIVVTVTPNMVRDGGAYEVRIVNPNGRQSNWVRVEFVTADPGVGNTGASIDARFPESLTVTAVTTTVPIELSVRNAGRMPVRVSNFEVVTPEGAKTPVAGSLDVPAGETRSLRLEAPIPLAAGAGAKTAAKLQLALAYKVTLVSSRNPTFDGRTPADGFATVSVRNEISIAEIGREYVAAPTPGAAEGWRFFKTENEANAGEGKAADFYLFAEPFAARDKLPTAELYNYRPDEGTPATRGVFYLVLRNNEISGIDARTRERGTRLGYVVTAESPGLVPLYRWQLTDGRRTLNHYLTVEKDASRLPRQMTQKPGWKLDQVVGYVVPRQR